MAIRGGGLRNLLLLAALTVGAALLGAMPAAAQIPAEPPLAKSSNVHVGEHVPGSFAGMTFKDHYAFLSGWGGITVLDIAQAESPRVVGDLPLPHFENEDVDLCGNVLMVVNDRATSDLGAILYVVSIANPTTPTVAAVLPLGLTGSGRGSGHIANFVKPDCSQAWIDGGDHVEVVDLSVPTAPRSLGKFESAAADSDAFRVSHDTELDSTGTVWNVGGGGAAGYRLTANPLAPQLLGTTGDAGRNPSPYNDFILHNSQRRGKTLLVTEEDYVDTDEVPPGGCRGQGKFETWDVSRLETGAITPQDTWETELNGMFTDGSVDSKAPVTVELLVALVRRAGRRRGRRLVRAGRPLPRLPHAHRHPAGRLLHPGQRIDMGGVLVADRPERRGRLHRRCLPRRRRAQDRQWRDHRQEGQGAGAQRVVRQPGDRRRVLPAAPDLRVRLPGAEG